MTTDPPRRQNKINDHRNPVWSKDKIMSLTSHSVNFWVNIDQCSILGPSPSAQQELILTISSALGSFHWGLKWLTLLLKLVDI